MARDRKDRKGAQLAVELEPQLLERLRARALADGRPVAALVRRWIEAGLSGELELGPEGPAAAGLADRVAELEAAVAQLQAGRASRPGRPAPVAEPAEQQAALPLVGDAEIPRSGDARLTTVELAQRTGTNKGVWNNWARGKAPGAVRRLPDGSAWRLAGQAPSPAGGPPRKLWEPA